MDLQMTFGLWIENFSSFFKFTGRIGEKLHHKNKPIQFFPQKIRSIGSSFPEKYYIHKTNRKDINLGKRIIWMVQPIAQQRNAHRQLWDYRNGVIIGSNRGSRLPRI